MTKPGILALWQDCAAGREVELEHWYQSEHLLEPVGVPGFRRGRRYEAVEARQRYLTYYETDAPEVLASPAYRELLDNPTPLTREIMSGVIKNMTRTICRLEQSAGAFRGAMACAVKLEAGADVSGLIAALATKDGVARVQHWVATEDIAPPASDEEKLRGRDAKIAACLLVETLREAEAREAVAAVREALGAKAVEIGLYRLICEREKV